MDTPILSGSVMTPSTGVTNYSPLQGSSLAFDATENLRRNIIPFEGVFRDFYVELDVAPGAGKSYSFTLVKNGVDTLLTLTISDAAVTGSNTTQSVSVVATDNISVKVVPTGTPAAIMPRWCIIFRSSANSSVILGSTAAANFNTGATHYAALQITGSTAAAIQNRDQIISPPGNIKNLYVELNVAPGAGKSYAFTLMKNGVATALTCTISDAATTGNDVANTVAVVAGDLLALRVVPTGTPTTTGGRWGLKFEPTTDGQSAIMYGGDNPPSTGATNFQFPNGHGNAWDATETNRVLITNSATFRNLYINMTNAPGAAKSYTFTIRKEAADTALTATVSGLATTANDTTNSFSSANGDILSTKSVPAGTPTISQPRIGITAFIQPTPIDNGFLMLLGTGA